MKNGCENCDQYLQMKGDIHRIEECTSKNFDGYVFVFGG